MAETNLYVQHEQDLTLEQIERLAVEGATISTGKRGQIIVQWPDVRVTVVTIPRGDELTGHLNGFRGFITKVLGRGVDNDFAALLETISSVETVFECHVEPDYDRENKAKSLLVSMACTYEAFMFADGNLYTSLGRLWFGAEDSTHYADLSELTVLKTELEEVDTTDRQQLRTKRMLEVLSVFQVPAFQHHIRWMPDDEDVTLRSPQDVARRLLAMHGVVCLARGRPREEVLSELHQADVISALSPAEERFLNASEVDEEQRMPMIWRLEALWQLMWALKYIDKFDWPSQMVDVEKLHDLIFQASQDDPAKFIAEAKLRSKRSILDTTELITRLHWAIRQAMIEGEPIPENLDWANPSNMVPVMGCPTVGVVAERHHALNWLIRYEEADWDDVDTPT